MGCLMLGYGDVVERLGAGWRVKRNTITEGTELGGEGSGGVGLLEE